MKIEKRTIWEEHIKAYRSSKLSAAVWCEQNNVSVHALRTWITKFNKESNASSRPNDWISVEISNTASKSKVNPSGICINIGSASIDVSSSFDPETLETVIEILSRQC